MVCLWKEWRSEKKTTTFSARPFSRYITANKQNIHALGGKGLAGKLKRNCTPPTRWKIEPVPIGGGGNQQSGLPWHWMGVYPLCFRPCSHGEQRAGRRGTLLHMIHSDWRQKPQRRKRSEPPKPSWEPKQRRSSTWSELTARRPSRGLSRPTIILTGLS